MYKVRMKVGGSIFDVREKLLKHSEAEVIEVDEAGTFLRLVDSTEWEREGFFDEPKAVVKEAPPVKKAAPKKASPKKKAVNKQTAIPVDDESLENIDVSSI